MNGDDAAQQIMVLHGSKGRIGQQHFESLLVRVDADGLHEVAVAVGIPDDQLAQGRPGALEAAEGGVQQGLVGLEKSKTSKTPPG